MPKQYKTSPKVKNAIKYANAFYEQFLGDLMKMNVLEVDALLGAYQPSTIKEMIIPMVAQSKDLNMSLNHNPLAQFMEGDDI